MGIKWLSENSTGVGPPPTLTLLCPQSLSPSAQCSFCLFQQRPRLFLGTNVVSQTQEGTHYGWLMPLRLSGPWDSPAPLRARLGM